MFISMRNYYINNHIWKAINLGHSNRICIGVTLHTCALMSARCGHHSALCCTTLLALVRYINGTIAIFQAIIMEGSMSYLAVQYIYDAILLMYINKFQHLISLHDSVWPHKQVRPARVPCPTAMAYVFKLHSPNSQNILTYLILTWGYCFLYSVLIVS